MRYLILFLFAIAGGLTLSGIVANIYRILARKPANAPERVLYLAIMMIAGPSVLFQNATRSFRASDCSSAAYVFAVAVTAYWSFALGAVILSLAMRAF